MQITSKHKPIMAINLVRIPLKVVILRNKKKYFIPILTEYIPIKGNFHLNILLVLLISLLNYCINSGKSEIICNILMNYAQC